MPVNMRGDQFHHSGTDPVDAGGPRYFADEGDFLDLEHFQEKHASGTACAPARVPAS
jgi:hypothetical protein